MAKQPDRFGGEAMSARLVPSSTVSAALISDLLLVGDEYSPRWGLAAAVLDDKVYLYGGYVWYHGAGMFHADLYEVDARHSTIRAIPAMGHEGYPRARFGHTLVALPQRKALYMFGGRDSDFCFAELWQYSTVDKQWTLLSPSAENRLHPSPRSWHSSHAQGNSVYIIGGWGNETDVVGEVWRYDLDAHQWSCLCSPQARSRTGSGIPPSTSHPAMTNPMSGYPVHPDHLEDKLNSGGTGSLLDSAGGRLYNNLTEVFCHEGRTCHQSVLWRNAIYVFGGVTRGNLESSFDLWRFDLETCEWSVVPTDGSNPGKRVSAASTLVGDTWILHGGMTSLPGGLGKTTSDVYQFDFLSSTWTRMTEVCLIAGCHALDSQKVERARFMRYGHAATTLDNGTPVFFGGAESNVGASLGLCWKIEFLPSIGVVRDLTELFSKDREERRLVGREMRVISEMVEKVNSRAQLLESECGYWRSRCEELHSANERLNQRIEVLQRQVKAISSAFQNAEPILSGLMTFASTIATGTGGPETPKIKDENSLHPTDRYGSAPARPLHSNSTNSPSSQPAESHLG